MPSLGPSENLLHAFQANEKMTWSEFRRRYLAELFADDYADKQNRIIKNHGQKFTLRLLQMLAKRGTVTVMCHCGEDVEFCHRHILTAILKKKI